jgi:pimeloyl-ACP methyl ester carboxylesterase
VYAAENPDRVDRLVVCCCPVVGALAAHPGDEAMHQEIDITAESLGLGWGAGSSRRRRMLAMQLMPDAEAGTWEGFGPSPRPTVSPENLARWLALWTSVDLSLVLPEIRVPTLVVQSRNDPIVPYHQGRLFGSLVPNCRSVELDSDNHLPIVGEAAWPQLVDELEAFLPR